MRQVLNTTLCLATCLLASVAWADDNAKVPEKKEADSKIEVQVQSSGKIIVIGADGEKKEIEFNVDGDDRKAFEDLPKEIRRKLEKAMKGLGKPEGVFGKGIMIGPDGKVKELDLGLGLDIEQEALKGLPREIREKIEAIMKDKGAGERMKFDGVFGHGVIIGPDGVKKEFKFGDAKAGGDALKGLPKEIREQFERALSKRTGIQEKIQKALKKIDVNVQVQDSKEKNVLENKLDLILKRLDKMEKDIAELTDAD